MKKILTFIIVLMVFFVMIYLFLSVIRLTRELTLLKKENGDYKKALEQNKSYISSLQKQSQDQLKQSVRELTVQQQNNETLPAKADEPGIHISALEVSPSNERKSIAFWVKGAEQMTFDAMDLGLIFSNMKASPLCTTGDVFSQYPLIEATEKYLTVTGVADISMGKINTGHINKLFISCTFEKKDPNQNTTVELDPTKTHIYFLGKPVLDLENSYKKSVW